MAPLKILEHRLHDTRKLAMKFVAFHPTHQSYTQKCINTTGAVKDRKYLW